MAISLIRPLQTILSGGGSFDGCSLDGLDIWVANKKLLKLGV